MQRVGRVGLAAALVAGVVGVLGPVLAPPASAAGTGTIDTWGGWGQGALTSSQIAFQSRDAVQDGAGNTYIADTANHVVWKVTPGGVATIYAGNATSTSTGDGGPATSASVLQPTSVALDAAGNLYIAELGVPRVRKVDAGTGTITTVAGGVNPGFDGDGGPATSAKLGYPLWGIGIAGDDDLVIADTSNHRVRRVDSVTGTITTIAGSGAAGFAGDGAAATAAQLNGPKGVGVDSAGNVLIADTENHRIRRVDAVTGDISTLAGTGAQGSGGDGGPATAAMLNRPEDVNGVATGEILVADTGSRKVRRISGGDITTVAGTGSNSHSGDGGAPTSAAIGAPSGIGVRAVDDYVISSSTTNRVREVTGSSIATLAGNGTPGLSANGLSRTASQLKSPDSMVRTSAGDVYVADSGNHAVRRIDGTTGAVTTVAGVGTFGTNGDGGPATSARLWFPEGLAMNGAGDLFIADSGSDRVRKVAAGTAIVTTVAGDGTAGFGGDGGAATSAQLDRPTGVAVDGAGNLYIADSNNNRIRKVAAGTDIITTFAGTGTAGFGGDGGPATAALLNEPEDIELDPAGNLVVADATNNRVRSIALPSGTIATIAGDGTSTTLQRPKGVSYDDSGFLLIADSGNNRVRRVAGGVIDTIAGAGPTGFAGDGGVATAALLGSPTDVLGLASGDVLIGDEFSNRIRIVTGIAGTGLHGISPVRVLDSRDGTGGFSTPWGAGTKRDVTVTGTGGIPPGATSVVLNLTAVGPSTATHLTVWPAGEPMPSSSNLNVPAGDVRPNLVVTKVGAGGKISIFNNSGTVHVLVDVTGYYDFSGDRFTGVSPVRLLDSRDGTGGFSTPWGAGTTRDLIVTGVGGVPVDATSVVLNVTAVFGSAPSHVTVFPAGEPAPNASNLNFPAGDVRPNLVVVKVGVGGKVSLRNNSGTVHLLADVVGYSSPSGGAGLRGLSPTRLVDSRFGIGGYSSPWGAGTTRDITVTGLAGVPADATAVVVNVTAVNPSASSHLTVFPTGEAVPVTSNLNFGIGQVVPNLVMVKVGSGGKLTIRNNSGSVDVVVDVVAYAR